MKGIAVLNLLPCLDTPAMAADRRRDLDIARATAADLGRTAVEASVAGHYTGPDGRQVDWSAAVAAAIEGTISVAPGDPLPASAPSLFDETRVQVTDETTLGASLRLVGSGFRPVALNFANGIHPGGGFLEGARAQEETLCRSSALFRTLVGDRMYQEHSLRPRPDSTEWAIYSPDVPVFRDDDGREIPAPWLLSFITCAAPVAARIGQPESRHLLHSRILRVLAIAQAYGHEALVLGAWGCGAFGNDPRHTAVDFRSALENEFEGAFSEVIFAIADWSPERRFLGPFRDVFAPIAGQ